MTRVSSDHHRHTERRGRFLERRVLGPCRAPPRRHRFPRGPDHQFSSARYYDLTATSPPERSRNVTSPANRDGSCPPSFLHIRPVPRGTVYPAAIAPDDLRRLPFVFMSTDKKIRVSVAVDIDQLCHVEFRWKRPGRIVHRCVEDVDVAVPIEVAVGLRVADPVPVLVKRLRGKPKCIAGRDRSRRPMQDPPAWPPPIRASSCDSSREFKQRRTPVSAGRARRLLPIVPGLAPASGSSAEH